MRTTRISGVLAAAAVAAAALMSAVPAAAATHAAAGTPRSECSATFFRGNKLLGPEQLPTRGDVAAELAGYHRTGGMPARHFLATFYDATANGGSGGWIYPPDNGYVTGPGGQPEEAQLQLYVGQDIDRYGSEFGAFLGPAGLPYSARSIPPQNLDGTPASGCNYHDYQVTRAFTVDAGPIAPWFGQPGGGTQFQLDGSLVPGARASLNVMWLVSNGYLARLP